MDYTVLISNVTIKAEYSMFGTSIGELLCLRKALTMCAHTVIAIIPGNNDYVVRIFQRIVPQNCARAHSLRRQKILNVHTEANSIRSI